MRSILHHTLWVMLSILLVLTMVFGISILYAGLARFKNGISSGFQGLFPLASAGVLWLVLGFSLAFSKGPTPLLGGFEFLLGNGLNHSPIVGLAPKIPGLVFMMFHLLFAAIACSLVIGCFLERVSLKISILFTTLWCLCIYVPVAHWVWGPGGWIKELGGLDFAGGLVVHITSGVSALALTLRIGRRQDYFKFLEKHNNTYILGGTALLWLGWFGFNSGSALALDEWAINAFVATFFAPTASVITWTIIDHVHTPHRTYMSNLSLSVVAGLVAITPSAGYVTLSGALIIGALTGPLCNYSVRLMHKLFKQDDTADVFSSHGICGIFGTLITPLFLNAMSEKLFDPYKVFWANFWGTISVIIYAFVVTTILFKLIDRFHSFRVSEKIESMGLDLYDHGDKAQNI